MDAIPAGNYILLISHDGFRDFDRRLASQRPLRRCGISLWKSRASTQKWKSTPKPIAWTQPPPPLPPRLRAAEIAELRRIAYNSLEFITSYTPARTCVHDQLHIRGGHQVSWLVDGVPVPNTNIAANVGAQFDPKDIDVVEIPARRLLRRVRRPAPMARSTSFAFGFERDRERNSLATYGSHHSTDSQLSSVITATLRLVRQCQRHSLRRRLMPPEPQEFHDNTSGLGIFHFAHLQCFARKISCVWSAPRAATISNSDTLEQQEIGPCATSNASAMSSVIFPGYTP